MNTPQKLSILYHDLFDYPLDDAELEKWAPGEKVSSSKYQVVSIKHKKDFYYLDGREGMIAKRKSNEKHSVRKLKIAKRSAKILSKIPSIKLVGITGALAMKNAGKDSDIDLMIITTKGTLWTTRLFSSFLLLAFGFKLRRYGIIEQRDKLCLNMWLDESDLVVKKRNIFTAHEIAQIKPIVNKNRTYEKLLLKNKWVLEYWPKAVKLPQEAEGLKHKAKKGIAFSIKLLALSIIELLAFKFQYLYMKSKITREVVTSTRAFFHPYDWMPWVLTKLDK